LGIDNPARRGRYTWERSFHFDAPHGRVNYYHFNAEIGPLRGFDHAPIPEWSYRLGSTRTLKLIGHGMLLAGLALDVYDIATAAPCDRLRAIGGAIGGWGGGAIGAAIGSAIAPGVVIGGVIGSAIGQYVGSRNWRNKS
jgi:hypothetical protein